MKRVIAPTPASRADWLEGIAASKGYTLGRDTNGRYRLERDGLSKRYMSFGACLEALNSSKDLPKHTARPRTPVPVPVVEEKPKPVVVVDAPRPPTGLTLTPGESMSGGGWWVSDGRFSIWKPTHEQAAAADASGEFSSKIPKRSGVH